MTPEDQAIVDAIWGESFSPGEEDKKIIEAIISMANLAAQRFAAGKAVVIPEKDTLH